MFISFFEIIDLKKDRSKELYGKLQLIWQTTLVSKWTNSWQPRDARDILFTAIQHYIDSGKDATLCSIKRPLKIYFAFGNNNEISVSIPGSGVRLAIFCSRVFCQRFNGVWFSLTVRSTLYQTPLYQKPGTMHQRSDSILSCLFVH